MNNVFVLKMENIIRDQITQNKCSMNVTWRTFIHNFEGTLNLIQLTGNVLTVRFTGWKVPFRCLYQRYMTFSTSSRQNQVHSSSLFPVQIFLFTSMVILFFHLYCTHSYLFCTLNFSLHMLFCVIYVLSCVSLYTSYPLYPLYLIVLCHMCGRSLCYFD